MSYPSPSEPSEAARLAAVLALDVLDTPAGERFDRYTRLASMAFNTPIALISVVDKDRQWFKSRCGLDVRETPRSHAFCSHAVAQREMLVVEDAQQDPRFVDNPLVTGAPHIRFYAGQPVFSEGEAVGSLCIIDRVPRRLDSAQRQVLRDLAALVEVELTLDKAAAARDSAERALKALNADLERRVRERTLELEQKIGELSLEVERRTAAESAFREADTRNRTIVASSYNGFIAVDGDGRIVEWNASAERIFGWTHRQAVGRKMAELIVPPQLRLSHEAGMRRFLETGESRVMDQKLELPALTESGWEITVEMTISTYEWKGQRYCGAFLNDISDRIRIQQQLEEKQELLDAVLESIDVAVVACDASGKLTVFNRAARSFHGQDLKSMSADEWSNYYSLYHADGRTPMRMDEVPLIHALQGQVVRDEAMAIVPNGREPRILLASGRPLRAAGGAPLGAVVAMKDITELNASREQLAASEERLRTIADNLPVLIAYLDQDRRYRFANAVHEAWLGVRPEDMLGKTNDEVFGQAASPARAQALERAWRGEASQCDYEIARDGQTRIVHSVVLPQVQDGVARGVYMLTTDATVSRMHERSLHALAHTDALTGLANRREFEQVLEGACKGARQGDRAFALLYLDVDHFKQINDRHGHAAGDLVLIEFARRLRAAVRATDIVARLAGDEFTILLGDTRSEAEVRVVASKILDAIRAPFVLDQASLSVTTTIGAALAAKGAREARTLTALADRALYLAKEAGRDTFAVLDQSRDAA